MFDSRVDQLVYDFNCRPIDYIDPSWLADDTRQWFSRVSASNDRGARGQCSLWLLQHFNLANEYDFDFSSPMRRVLLLDSATLRDISLSVGLSSLTHELRTWVGRERNQQLRAQVGDSMLDFFSRQILRWPPVARVALSGRSGGAASGVSGLLHTASSIGVGLLLACCDSATSPVGRRAQMKLPMAIADGGPAFVPSQRRKNAVFEFVVRCVICERHPACQWLF